MWCESQRGWVLLPAGARALCPRLEERQTCVCVLISFFFSLDGNQACTYNRLWRGAAQVVPGSHFRVSFFRELCKESDVDCSDQIHCNRRATGRAAVATKRGRY